ncbi:magnesium/cobalt transporter CorA [Streptomyces zingiberis]|uniref:magnesium/cobalt transporter CorA n=1 Tax=Streptomyces zingiberis TaxID=2053010 RepID=UPI002893618C|nr:magnesium/cobalt transporter CorA [Streptomyces zingiberis]
MIVDCAIYQDGQRAEQSAPDISAALAEARERHDAFLWIGLHEPAPEEFDRVSREFGLHPLAVEDALKAHQRPKLEVYDDSLFVVLKPVVYDAAEDTVTAEELMIFLGDSFVVTVRHGDGSPLGAVRHRLEREREVLRHGPTAVLYALSDSVVDHYIDVAAELQLDLEELEASVFAPDVPDMRNTAARIYTLKRQILEFRRATGPLAAPMDRLTHAALPFVDTSSRPFFRDVSDHLTRANESVEGLDRLISDVLAAHLAQTGVRQNDDMRKISAWAAMAAVPTLVAGIYGMNFDTMPELHASWGYPAVLGLMAGAVLLLRRTFKRRGWL